ncbi:unnamed protein product [Sphagnum jensenii]|uniref:Uncharacterized protein n=1 Tax=Sphagnum jensenii TaxID=128206 RepID=A0ABP0V6C8_9BRYO
MSNTGVTPNFGIKWELVINTTPDSQGNQQQLSFSQSDFSSEGLQIEFFVFQSAKTDGGWWRAEIVIYGLNSPTLNLVLTQGLEVVLSAGFQNGGPYGLIWQGVLMQPMFELENVTSYKLTLLCMIGLVQNTNQLVNGSFAKNSTQRQVVAAMASKYANPPIPVQDISGVDDQNRSSRGSIVFGQPYDYFADIAKVNLNNFWISNQGLNIKNLGSLLENNPNPSPDFTYDYTNGLVGTPQQTQDGVEFNVLLDPRLQIGSVVQLNPLNVAINQFVNNGGNLNLLNQLTQPATYVVGGLEHYGSSRGNTWFTKVIGYTTALGKLALLAGA